MIKKREEAQKEVDAKDQPTTDFAATHADCPFAGHGGSYEVIDGKRVLVSRTGLTAEKVQKANEEADAIRAAKAKE